MLFDSEWPGDAIAAPVYGADNREDEMLPCLDGGPWNPTDIRLGQSAEDPVRCDLAKSTHRRRWVVMVTSILGQLRSKMRRRREIRRINAGWAMVDDRMLKDIGISRLALEYARGARHWGWQHCLTGRAR